MSRGPVNKWLITVSVMIPTMIEILDTSVGQCVAETTSRAAFSAGQEEVTWVLTSYLVANAVVIPMSGWLAGVFGRKRYLIGSIIIFYVGLSPLAAWPPAWKALSFSVYSRGSAGEGSSPCPLAILMEAFSRGRTRHGHGRIRHGQLWWGPSWGRSLGGYLTDTYSWRWIFLYQPAHRHYGRHDVHDPLFLDPPNQRRVGHGQKNRLHGPGPLCAWESALFRLFLDKGQLEDWFSSNFNPGAVRDSRRVSGGPGVVGA